MPVVSRCNGSLLEGIHGARPKASRHTRASLGLRRGGGRRTPKSALAPTGRTHEVRAQGRLTSGEPTRWRKNPWGMASLSRHGRASRASSSADPPIPDALPATAQWGRVPALSECNKVCEQRMQLLGQPHQCLQIAPAEGEAEHLGGPEVHRFPRSYRRCCAGENFSMILETLVKGGVELTET